MSIRIAIATADGASLSDHLAHSAAFVVLEVEDGRIVSRAVRAREAEGCGNHKSFVEMLEGCNAVICGGIGEGAFNALRANGIESVVAAGQHSIDEAARQYLAGTLPVTTEFVCLCHEH
jgi:predicted Fe-Mo cluster-binding NifX family protein